DAGALDRDRRTHGDVFLSLGDQPAVLVAHLPIQVIGDLRSRDERSDFAGFLLHGVVVVEVEAGRKAGDFLSEPIGLDEVRQRIADDAKPSWDSDAEAKQFAEAGRFAAAPLEIIRANV